MFVVRIHVMLADPRQSGATAYDPLHIAIRLE
jgi:hypothetical protein